MKLREAVLLITQYAVAKDAESFEAIEVLDKLLANLPELSLLVFQHIDDSDELGETARKFFEFVDVPQ